MLHLAGRIADGVIAGTGLSPEVVSDTIDRVNAGATEAGRSLEDCEIWFTTRSSLATAREYAIEDVYGAVSSILNHAMRFGLEGKNVPDQLKEKVQQYVDGYVLYEHVQNRGENPRRMQTLGLTEYALDRFALAGNPNDWIRRIEGFLDAGVKRIWVSPAHNDLDRQKRELVLFRDEIAPHFR